MAGFGLPNFGQLTEAFRKAQQIQQDAQKLQDELDSMELEGTSEDGRASVWLSGNQQPCGSGWPPSWWPPAPKPPKPPPSKPSEPPTKNPPPP